MHEKKSLAVVQPFQLSLVMRVITMRKAFFLLPSLILMSQTMAILFCGEVDCLQGKSDENCATLLCSILARDAAPVSAPDHGSATACDCYCHILIDLPKIDLCATHLDVTTLYTVKVLHVFVTPVYDIYHPPLA
jgi:hypothetical protein